jgi:hypothetical protein
MFKYFTKILPYAFYYLGCPKKVDVGNNNFYFHFAAYVNTTVISLYWDFKYDWGLFGRTLPGKRFLRNEMVFSPNFYYFAMV